MNGTPRRTGPGAQDGEAHFSIFVQVGVEADSAAARGHDPDGWRVVWVVVREPQNEVEETPVIRSVRRPVDEGVDEAHSLGVRHSEDAGERVF